MNTSFETIILKKLTHSGEYFGKCMPILKKKFFTETGNQELFALIQTYYLKYRNIPSLTELVASVRGLSNSEIREEVVKSLQEINKTEELTNLEFACDETVQWIKDALYMEALMIGSEGLMKKNNEMKLKAKQIMEEMAKVNIDSDLGLDFDDIDDMIAYYSAKNVGIISQHDELNKRLGPGFLPGTLSIILAAASVGKSLMMTDLISGIFVKNKNILLVSLEMADKEIMKRVHANAMDLPINSLLDLNKSDAYLNKIKDRSILTKEEIIQAYNKVKMDGTCGKLFIKDYAAGSFTPLMLEQLLESYQIEKQTKFDLVIIDYLGLMASDLVTPSAGLYSYIKSIGEETRAVAKKANVPILSASQLNRSATNKDDADNSSISDSMGTAMTADFMLFLLQNEEMKIQKQIACKVTKNRFNGRTDTWIMGIDYEHMRFHDIAIQNNEYNNGNSNIDIEPIGKNTGLQSDFGVITAESQKNAESFVKQEISDIHRNDAAKLAETNAESNKSGADPFEDDMAQIYKDLDIDL